MEKKKQEFILTEEGRKYLKHGLPEKALAEMIEKSGGRLVIDEARKLEGFNIALNWAKRNGWIKIDKEFLLLNEKPKSFYQQEALESIDKKEEADEKIINDLVSRKLVVEDRETELVRATAQAKQKEVSSLTPELLKTGLWKKVSLRPYNIEAAGKILYPGKKHIISLYIEKIRKIFLDMGFTESEGPMIESSFWNFDALFQPQDHPARDMADTFYMKHPKETKLPEKYISDKVRDSHESGVAGSTGWGYEWKEDIAKKPIMRTHTTAVSARMLSRIQPPAKIFCIGRVFRNETIDYKHLAEFTQVEGIVVDENVNFKNLLGYIKEFYSGLGFSKVRFRPAYFPYTEMSVEPEVYFEERGEWMELGGAGIFRPEVTKPLGIDCPVLAWGLGLERPIMLRTGLNDIRNFYYRNDVEFLRSVNTWL